MEISEVRIKLVSHSTERLRAFCSVTLDGEFVIRDLKIIEGTNGAFVAMPSRKLADRCPRCKSKNNLRAKFCGECGGRLRDNRVPKDGQGRAKLHADVAHPINAACRERIQTAVIEAYQTERERAKAPDYQPPAFDDLDEDYELEENAAPSAPVVETPTAEKQSEPADDDFSDYNSLIADLRRDAEDRRRPEPARPQAGDKWSRPAGDEDAEQEPARRSNGGKTRDTRKESPPKKSPPPHEPAQVSSEPATVSSRPARISSEPATVSSEPAPTSSEPAIVSSQLATVSSEPATGSSEPVSVSSQPASASSKPPAAHVQKPQTPPPPSDDFGAGLV